MKLALALATVALCTGTSAFAQSVSQADRESAIKYLESTRQSVINATKDLSEDQWNFERGSGPRSIAEELEHIAAAEDLYFTLVSQVVMKAPARPAGDKATGPDEPAPTNRFDSPEAALSHFLESRDRTIQFLKEAGDLRAHAMEGPMGKKKLDAYEWILFMAAHSDQHATRILQVKADSNFPKM